MTELEKIKLLMSKVEAIGLKYAGVAEREQHDFNVFSILREPHEEVGLHSSFLASLFNPNSGHRQGKRLLNKFLEAVNLPMIPEEEQVQVFREYTRLRKTSQGKKRDSIDIYIKTTTRAIVIENKIYAGDQENQIERYVDFARSEGFTDDQINVIYLTLDGHEPTNYSRGKIDKKKITLASYQSNILPWIEQCIQHMVIYPTTRETMILYGRLVQQLTGQSMNEEETMEIAKNLASNKETMQLVRKIIGSYSTAKAEIQLKFWESLEKALTLHNFTYRIMDKNDKASQKYDKDQIERFYSGARPRPWYGIKIHLGTLDNTNMDICFMVEVEHNIYYGFIAQERDKEWTKREHLKNAAKDEISNLCKTMGYGASDWWLGWRYPQIGYPNFMNFNDKADEMADDHLRLEYVSKLAKEIIVAIQDFRNEIEDKHIAVKWGRL